MTKFLSSIIFLLPLTMINSCSNKQVSQTGDFISKEYQKYKINNAKNQTPTKDELISAVKQLLIKGSQSATDNIGVVDGFYKNPQYKIPIPDSLQKVSDTLKKFGFEKYVDDFDISLNRAAEKAVPEAISVFEDMINSMTVTDALELIKGEDDAVSKFFITTQSKSLRNKFLPIISKATEEVGATQLYTKLQTQMNLLGAKLPDVNDYVTRYATQVLYKELVKEEKLIRKDPITRTNHILKKVFGFYNSK